MSAQLGKSLRVPVFLIIYIEHAGFGELTGTGITSLHPYTLRDFPSCADIALDLAYFRV